jgi:prepilin-type N-terminal cleavage/methylation domain-containing protein
MKCETGVTLIELVVVLVILAVASVPLFGQFSQASMTLLSNERIQTAAQLAQERAELIMGWRRNLGYNTVQLATGTTTESLAGNYTGYTRTTVISQPPLGPGCPVGATCKEVVITVDRSGTPNAEVTLVLADY